MKLTFLGTGDARQVPVWGCQCKACIRAKVMSNCQRRASCLVLESDGFRYLLDAGVHALSTLFQPEEIDGILVTHFHVDHVLALFQLRWGEGAAIPVHCPRDKHGCADLYRNSGLFKFKPFKKILTPLAINERHPGFQVTALPLNHSKETLGYALSLEGQKIAYLCDTKGLPLETEQYLMTWQPNVIIVDCTFAPDSINATTNHNTFNDVLVLQERFIDAGVRTNIWLTHIGHEMDMYLMDQYAQLPANVYVAQDGSVINFEMLS